MGNTNEGKILVIDDEEVICRLIKDSLTQKGYSVTTTLDAKSGLKAAQQNGFDVILVDLRLPDMDGLTVVKQIKEFAHEGFYTVVIIITGYPSFDTVQESLRLGVFDYVAKPFELEELTFTIKRAVDFQRLSLENKRLMEHISQENITLEKRLSERTEDLRASYLNTVKALVQALEARDYYTYCHSENVTKYAVMIAQEMGLSNEEINDIKEACELHDLGKISIQDRILNKPGKLSPEEWKEVKLHPSKSAEILEPLKFLNGITALVRQHHERYDGKGYPNGLKQEEIKIGARIMALADAFDAMTSQRPYRKRPLSKEEAVLEIKKNAGTQFDPRVVEAFLKIVDKL